MERCNIKPILAVAYSAVGDALCVCVCVCLEEYLEMGEIKMEIVGKISKGGVFRGLVEGKSKLRFRVKGFPGGSVVKNTTPVFLPGESQGQGSLVGCRLWGCTELDTTEVT